MEDIKLLPSADNYPMTANEWFKFYEENEGIFWEILRQRIRCRKYDLEYGSDLDDLMQASIENVIKTFNKKKTIPYRYRYTAFKLAAKNAVNTYIRQLNLFKGVPADSQKFDIGFNGSGEKVLTTSDNYTAIDFKVDLSLILNNRQQKIVNLLNMKYKKVEIAKMLGINERNLYKQLNVIKKRIEAAGLHEYA